MNGDSCAGVLDRLPDLAAGRLSADEADAVRAHLGKCPSCSEEWEMVSLLVAAGPAPVPAGLEGRVRAAVRAQALTPSAPRLRRRIPAWGLAAAAGLVLAVATPVLVERMADSPASAPVVEEVEVAAALEERLPSPWLEEEHIVAGAPVLDGLSDEALERLLRELGG